MSGEKIESLFPKKMAPENLAAIERANAEVAPAEKSPVFGPNDEIDALDSAQFQQAVRARIQKILLDTFNSDFRSAESTRDALIHDGQLQPVIDRIMSSSDKDIELDPEGYRGAALAYERLLQEPGTGAAAE